MILSQHVVPLFYQKTKMAPKKKPPQKRSKPEDWNAPAKIQRPPTGTPDPEVDAWVERMQERYETLNKADRVVYQKVRGARNARRRYGERKEDPVFLAAKATTQRVSNFFTLNK